MSSSDKEKESIRQVEEQPTSDSLYEGRILTADERIAAEKRLLRKLDWTLMPCIFLIYIMNYIDRTAITSARLKGLEQDLHLSDIQYNAVIAILYVSYCPAQIPSNMILNRIQRPSIYIGTCAILWGITSAATGAVTSFGGIMACRVFIGLPEAAFYPGALYLLSRWYTRKEMTTRSGILYVGLLFSNAFGALMAAGILGTMDGKRGIRAWRWLFIIEGAITVAVGLCTILILPDYPHNTKSFTPDERRLAQIRLAEDAAEADEDTRGDTAWTGLKLALADPKVLLFSVMNLAQLLGLSFLNFFPTLTSTLGFGTVTSLLLAAPPWFWTAIICLANAWHADKTGERFLHMNFPWWGVLVGYIIALSSMKTAPRYFSMFLMASGYATYALTLVWVSNSIPRPPAKRAAAMGIVNGFGNIGNLIGSFAWKSEWSPEYHQSLGISFASLGLASLLTLVIRQILAHDNQELDKAEIAKMKEPGVKERVEDAARLEGITFEEAVERKKGFRYLL